MRGEGDEDFGELSRAAVRKILIADDEENQRRLYAQEFRDEGYEVT